MWLSHDFAWWGVVLAVVGLVLMFPTAILANILTPKLQNWWAARSLASAAVRAAGLQAELAELEKNYELLSESDDFMLRGVTGAVGAIFVAMQLITIVGYIIVIPPDPPPHVTHLEIARVALILATMAAVFAFSFVVKKRFLDKIADYWRKRSRRRRTEIQRAIEKLQEKVHQFRE